MRLPLIAAAPLVFGFAVMASSAPLAAEPAALEQAWHDCVREAFAHQHGGRSKAGSQRNALDACKEQEDAFVAAMVAVQASEDALARRSGPSLPARARAWVASVATYVVDPVSSWIELLRR